MAKEIGTIEQALADLREGKVILVIDDPERENEGDLVCAAEFATPENVNFMACEAKGLICMPMTGELCKKLDLEQMVSVNTDNHSTAFTVSVDHVDTTTGISAFERSYTAIKMMEDDAKPTDFRRPGHMFPLRAREGGVLVRDGHTELTVEKRERFLHRVHGAAVVGALLPFFEVRHVIPLVDEELAVQCRACEVLALHPVLPQPAASVGVRSGKQVDVL